MHVIIYIHVDWDTRIHIYIYIRTYICNWDKRRYRVIGPINLTRTQIAGQSIGCLGVSDRVKGR